MQFDTQNFKLSLKLFPSNQIAGFCVHHCLWKAIINLLGFFEAVETTTVDLV